MNLFLIHLRLSLTCTSKMVLHHEYLIYHQINKSHHISFNLMVIFIDPMVETRHDVIFVVYHIIDIYLIQWWYLLIK